MSIQSWYKVIIFHLECSYEMAYSMFCSYCMLTILQTHKMNFHSFLKNPDSVSVYPLPMALFLFVLIYLLSGYLISTISLPQQDIVLGTMS